jgi:hypothetical protein
MKKFWIVHVSTKFTFNCVTTAVKIYTQVTGNSITALQSAEAKM